MNLKTLDVALSRMIATDSLGRRRRIKIPVTQVGERQTEQAMRSEMSTVTDSEASKWKHLREDADVVVEVVSGLLRSTPADLALVGAALKKVRSADSELKKKGLESTQRRFSAGVLFALGKQLEHALDSGQAERIRALLANPGKRAVADMLAAHGELWGAEVARMRGITAPVISRHLQEMEEAGVVNLRTIGRRQLASLTLLAQRVIQDL